MFYSAETLEMQKTIFDKLEYALWLLDIVNLETNHFNNEDIFSRIQNAVVTQTERLDSNIGLFEELFLAIPKESAHTRTK
jgi:hypothetical protein